MLTTNNDVWAAQARTLRVMGAIGLTQQRRDTRTGPYADPPFPIADHSDFPPLHASPPRAHVSELHELGSKSYMSAVQAAVGRVQLRRLASLNAKRAAVAHRYSTALKTIGDIRPVRVAPEDQSAWHLYTCLIETKSGISRDRLIHHLQEVCGIQIVLRYWPLHLNSILAHRGHHFGEAPECERVWFEQQLNLPISPSMQEWEIEAVIDALESGVRECRRSPKIG